MTSFAYTLGTRYTRAASARDAVGRLRASGRSTRSARRYEGTEGCTHLCNIPSDFIVLAKARKCTKREGRACRVRLRNADAAHAQVWQRPMWLRRPEYRATPQSVFAKVQGRNRRPRPFGQYDNPIISRPSPVDEAAREPASKPISVSLCLRALRVDRPEATRCTRAASARGAVWWFHASDRSTRSARRHKGNTKREGRACRVRWGGRTPTGCGRDKRGPPVCLTCMIIRSFPVPFPSDHFSSLSSG